ncbi:hypothetical protein DL96DRAFT_1464308 [Flagelloscypha sp. PMI_526]|nr:hypothetical protein DL96DRAFT_1464308 [Flagelloscypha sp. PMI_526]
MGRLVIAHHKSYHPYRRDNIERVRQDEEEAARQEAVQEGRVLLADSEARIDLLRQNAGLSSSKKRKPKVNDDDDIREALEGKKPEKQGHINLFEDLEMNAAVSVARATKKQAPESERGMPLAPSAKDLKPWYNTSTLDQELDPIDHKARGKKDRDVLRKTSHDPLTSINRQLASSSSSSRSMRPPPPIQNSDDPHIARLSRESSERQRALALIARKKREKEMLTPSTVYEPSEYGDMFNREDVEAARKERERGWGRRANPRDRGWNSQRHQRPRDW